MAKAIYTEGSIGRHIVATTFASSIGLVTLFIVDLVDMYFLSLLGDQALVAGVGFAGALLFLLTAICIGVSISMAALVSRRLGEGNKEAAKAFVGQVLLFAGLFVGLLSLPVWFYQRELLMLLGAEGRALELALQYSTILIPSTFILALAMSSASALRAIGDAKRSMWATVAGALVNAIFDPIFIFGFDLGIEGAAWASLLSRITVFWVAFHCLLQHQFIEPLRRADISLYWPRILHIALPAVLTNFATPVANSYVMKSMAEFGDGAVAASAVLGRLAPVAFCAIFSLSGAVAPIVGQNLGAKKYGRVKGALGKAVLFVFAYVFVVWLLLSFGREWLVLAFDAEGEAAWLINVYCTWLAGGFVFSGFLFVANATFNNTGAPHMATTFNYARSLLGTIPLVYLFSQWWGAVGVLIGEVAGPAIFGCLALLVAYHRVNRMAADDEVAERLIGRR